MVASEMGEHLIDGFEELFRGDLSGESFVGAGSILHTGNAIVFVPVVPGRDGTPGELSGVCIFISEGKFTDLFDAVTE